MRADNLGMDGGDRQTNEEGTRRTETKGTDPDRPNRRAQRDDDKQREQG